MRISSHVIFGLSVIVLSDLERPAAAQTSLPEVVVRRPKETPKPSPPTARRRAPPPAPAPPRSPPSTPEQTAAAAAAAGVRAVQERTTTLDRTRDQGILPKIGTNQYQMNRDVIVSLPQGENTPVERALLV